MAIKKYIQFRWISEWNEMSWPVCWCHVFFPSLNRMVRLFYFRYRPKAHRINMRDGVGGEVYDQYWNWKGIMPPAVILDGPKISKIISTYRWSGGTELVSNAPKEVCALVKV